MQIISKSDCLFKILTCRFNGLPKATMHLVSEYSLAVARRERDKRYSNIDLSFETYDYTDGRKYLDELRDYMVDNYAKRTAFLEGDKS